MIKSSINIILHPLRWEMNSVLKQVSILVLFYLKDTFKKLRQENRGIGAVLLAFLWPDKPVFSEWKPFRTVYTEREIADGKRSNTYLYLPTGILVHLFFGRLFSNQRRTVYAGAARLKCRYVPTAPWWIRKTGPWLIQDHRPGPWCFPQGKTTRHTAKNLTNERVTATCSYKYILTSFRCTI